VFGVTGVTEFGITVWRNTEGSGEVALAHAMATATAGTTIDGFIHS